MRPLIAVTGRVLEPGRVARWWNAAVASPRAYTDALHRAGAVEAVLLPVAVSVAEAADRLERFDGVVLTGGPDVDPARYGEEPHPEVYGVHADTDAFEIALACAAVERGVPLLGICRGMQVLNVALGGTLDQHISDRPGLLEHGRPHVGAVVHPVRVEPGTRLARAVGGTEVTCSSHHHQAVAKLARDLVPTGWTSDGLVEAAELDGDGWVVAVQWHPEETALVDPMQQRLFDAFVAEAAAHAE